MMRAAAGAAFGAEVDDPVRGLDDVEVVLDHDHRVAVVAQPVQHGQQQLDVVEVQAGRRLVEDVERAPGVALGQLERELHALRLAAGERGRRLAERDVAEADVEQRRELARDRGHRLEERVRLLDRHREHFVDVLALVADLERLAVVALAVADVARHVDVGQEVHLDLDQAVALARLAAPALHVEREASRAVAALARFLHLREQLADRREEPGVGRRIAARRAPDRALVDADHLVEVLEPFDLVVRRRLLGAVVQMPRDRVVERVVDERRLARARHAGHADEQADRQLQRHALQVVAARAGDRELARRRRRDAAAPESGSAGGRRGTGRSANAARGGCPRACPARRPARRARRRRAPCRRRSRRPRSLPRRARRRSRCCRGRAGA